MKTVETTATEVYLHAADHGDRPVIHGAEIDYDDVHDGVHYHADLLRAAEKQAHEADRAATSARSAMSWAAERVAIVAELADADGRDPRTWGTTYAADVGRFRKARDEWHAAHDIFMASCEARDALRAKRDQDAVMATYEVSA